MAYPPVLSNPSFLFLDYPTGNYTSAVMGLAKALSFRHRVIYATFTPQDTLTKLCPVEAWLGATGEVNLRVEKTQGRGSFYTLSLPLGSPLQLAELLTLPVFLNQPEAQTSLHALIDTVKALASSNLIVVNAAGAELGLALLGCFDEKLRVYYCQGPDSSYLLADYLDVVSTVVTTDRDNYSVLRNRHPNCHWVPPGFDYGLFADTFSPPSTRERPVIGFLDEVVHGLDLQLVGWLARHAPAWDFHLAGDETHWGSYISHLPNVSLLGSLTQAAQVEAMRQLDAAMLPFAYGAPAMLNCLLVDAYLAAGRPVVATPALQLPEHLGFVLQAHQPEIFYLALQAVLTHDSLVKRLQRMTWARGRDWQARAKQFLHAIATYYLPL